MRRAVLGLLLVAGLGAPPVLAQPLPWTADDLRLACSNGDLYYLYGACAGYLAAAVAGAEAGSVCLPEEADLFTLTPAMDRIALVPPSAGEAAGVFALRALAESFPCAGVAPATDKLGAVSP